MTRIKRDSLLLVLLVAALAYVAQGTTMLWKGLDIQDYLQAKKIGSQKGITSLQEVYGSSELLLALNESPGPEIIQERCQFLQGYPSLDHIEDIFYYVQSYSNLGCTFMVQQQAQEIILKVNGFFNNQGLDILQVSQLSQAYQQILNYVGVDRANEKINSKIKEYVDLFKRQINLETGSTKNVQGEKASITNTGLLIQIVKVAQIQGIKVDDTSLKLPIQILKRAKINLNINGLGKRYDQSSLQATSLILQNIPDNQKFSDNFNADQMKELVEFLSKQIQSQSLDNLALIYKALQQIQKILLENGADPVVLTQSTESFDKANQVHDKLTYQVTDIQGRPQDKSLSLNLVKILRIDSSQNKKHPIQFQKEFLRSEADGSLYELEILNSLDIGYYRFQVEASFPPQQGQEKMLGQFLIQDRSKISKLKGGSFQGNDRLNLVDYLQDSNEQNLNFGSINYGSKLKFQADIQGENSGQALNPEQVVVIVENIQTKMKTYFAPSKNTEKGQDITISLQKMEEQHYLQEGEYQMTLLVGGQTLSNSILRGLGSFSVQKGTIKSQALDEETRFLPKKEIYHVMRAPDKRPIPILSYLFTLVAFVPFTAFIYVGAQIAKPRLEVFPQRLQFLTISFLLTILSFLFLFAYYWVFLNLEQLVKPLIILSFITYFVGQRTLQQLSLYKVQQEKAQKQE